MGKAGRRHGETNGDDRKYGEAEAAHTAQRVGRPKICGIDSIDDLVPACRKCNGRKG